MKTTSTSARARAIHVYIYPICSNLILFVLIVLAVLAVGCPIASKSIKIYQIHQNPSKLMQDHENHTKSHAKQSKWSAQVQEQERFIFTYTRFARFTCLIPFLIISKSKSQSKMHKAIKIISSSARFRARARARVRCAKQSKSSAQALISHDWSRNPRSWSSARGGARFFAWYPSPWPDDL